MRSRAHQTRENRTITVDFQNEATYVQLLGDGKAFVELVMAFILSLGFQLKHKATCQGGGCLTRHSHYVRVRLGGVTIWRIQCTTCHAVFTVLPHFVLRYRSMRPEVARNALLATHGGLSLELCAVIGHISPMALYRLICALGHQSLVAVLTRCGLPLPASILADEKHSRCLTERVYLPTIVRGRVIWHLGHSASKSAAAFTESSGVFQRAALAHEPSYQVRGALTDGFDSTVSSLGPSRDKGLTRVASLATMRPQHAGPVAAGDARPPDAPDRAALSLPPRTAPMAYHGGTRPSSAALSDWRPSLLALDGARQRSTAQAKTVRRLAAECPRPSHSTASSRLVGMGAGRHGWQRHVAVSGRARRRRAVQYMVGARE